MYEQSQEIVLSNGSVSMFPNNLSVLRHEQKHATFACVAHKNQVNTVMWDPRMEGFNCDMIPIKDGAFEKPVLVLQVKYCIPACCTSPLLVIASTCGAMVFDPTTSKMLAWNPIITSTNNPGTNERCRFTRGISSLGNSIFVETHSGDIIVFFHCTSETSLQMRRPLQVIVTVTISHYHLSYRNA
ncbi:hypothetical protein AB6A40_006833 [Gnathostoma spinigerum]|uniref:WD repeat-containing protein 54 beta-propeller domain-containing protein n=1 Tax=Gnathostoma spinigerum TaxID=75299 RepID=A0ABD6EPN1_9BILA